jgi:hypothetical protein
MVVLKPITMKQFIDLVMTLTKGEKARAWLSRFLEHQDASVHWDDPFMEDNVLILIGALTTVMRYNWIDPKLQGERLQIEADGHRLQFEIRALAKSFGLPMTELMKSILPINSRNVAEWKVKEEGAELPKSCHI